MKTHKAEYNWPIEFKTVATAVAFSPGAKANLYESIRIANMLNACMVFIHVGFKTPTTEQKMEEILAGVEVKPKSYKVIWKSGDPTQAILEACKEADVDLLIAGVMQNENLVQYFKGSISRRLCRKANCSLLLLTHPDVESTTCDNIVVNGLEHPKTADTIKMAVYMANAFNSHNLTIVEEVDPKKIKSRGNDDLSVAKTNREMAHIERYEKHRSEDILKGIPRNEDLVIKDKCIFGKQGYTIGHYSEKNHVDLLILNSPDTKLGILDRVFTHNLEYILSDIPTDILIIHTTKKIVDGLA